MASTATPKCDICGREAAGGVSVFAHWTRLCSDDLADWQASAEKAQYDETDGTYAKAQLFGAWLHFRRTQRDTASSIIRASVHGS